MTSLVPSVGVMAGGLGGSIGVKLPLLLVVVALVVVVVLVPPAPVVEVVAPLLVLLVVAPVPAASVPVAVLPPQFVTDARPRIVTVMPATAR